MWVFLPEGFVSIVADRSDPSGGRLLVRARRREHLEAFLGGPEERIEENPSADYRWRAWVPYSALGGRTPHEVYIETEPCSPRPELTMSGVRAVQ